MDQIYASIGAGCRWRDGQSDADRTLRHRHHRQRRRRRHDGARARRRPARASSSSSAATSSRRKPRTGARSGLEAPALPDDRALARRATAASSGRTRTTASAATPSSGAACCTGCGARTSRRRRARRTASRRRGRSTTTRSRRTTTAPSACTTCTARPASIRPSRRAGRFRIRRFRTRAAWPRIVEQLRAQGLHPSPLPLGLIDPGERTAACSATRATRSRAGSHAKSDADVCCVRPALRAAERRRCGPTRRAAAAHRRVGPASRGGRGRARRRRRSRVDAPLVVVSCGAVNSAALLLRSANDTHPNGLANSSGLVGRRYMAHLATMMQGFHPLRMNDDGVSEDGRDQRFLPARARHAVSARTDPVAGPHARRDGQVGDTWCSGIECGTAAVGVRCVGARAASTGWRCPRICREPRTASRSTRTAAFACTTGPTTCARTSSSSKNCARHAARLGLLVVMTSRTRTAREHDAPVRHARVRHRPAHRRCSIRSAARTTSRTSSSSTPRSSPRRRPSIPG